MGRAVAAVCVVMLLHVGGGMAALDPLQIKCPSFDDWPKVVDASGTFNAGDEKPLNIPFPRTCLAWDRVKQKWVTGHGSLLWNAELETFQFVHSLADNPDLDLNDVCYPGTSFCTQIGNSGIHGPDVLHSSCYCAWVGSSNPSENYWSCHNAWQQMLETEQQKLHLFRISASLADVLPDDECAIERSPLQLRYVTYLTSRATGALRSLPGYGPKTRS